VLKCPVNPITKANPVSNHCHVTIYLLSMSPYVAYLLESICVTPCTRIGNFTAEKSCICMFAFSTGVCLLDIC
jgi:hypothetical protein